MNIFVFLKEHFQETVSTTLGYSTDEFEIIKIYLESSNLFEEFTLLISHQKKMGFFQQTHSLEEFKFDPVNNCGVLYKIQGENNNSKTVIRSFGNEQILLEKKWI